MRTAEQNEVLGTFLSLLEGATGDGAAKRARGEKPSWKVDRSHLAAAYRHLDPSREPYDEDSGLPKEVHAAWRLLAVAWQRMHDDGKLPAEPPATVTYTSTTTLAHELAAKAIADVRDTETLAERGKRISEAVSRLPDRWWLKRPDHDAEPVRIPTARTYVQPADAPKPDVQWLNPPPLPPEMSSGPLVREHQDGTVTGIVDPEAQAAKNWGAPDPGQSADHAAVGFGDWGSWWNDKVH